jgi:hypothetical protein
VSVGVDVGVQTGEETGTRCSPIAPVSGDITGLFVDPTVPAGNDYNDITRSATGGGKTSFTTIQAAVNAMVSGTDVWIRGGTYFENVEIKGSTHPDGTPSNYCSLQSYPGEWAKVDGQNNQQYTIGKNRSGADEGNDLAYWKFERLEITGGCITDGGAGLYINRGPFIVRFCYIHDNIAPLGGENPGGIVGYTWVDTIIEFCWFFNNGMDFANDGNAAHIANFSDNNTERNFTAEFGFQERMAVPKRNIYRYNYFDGSTVAFKHKASQILAGRNVAGPLFESTFQNYGDKFHHNFVKNARRDALVIEQDFCQVYNNIFEQNKDTINVQYQPGVMIHNVCVYNNTSVNPHPYTKLILRYGQLTLAWSGFTQTQALHGYDLNNIMDEQPAPAFTEPEGQWFTGTGINPFGDNVGFPSPDVTNYVASHNYFYRPNGVELFKLNNTYYTKAEWEAQSLTGSPKVVYSKASTEANDRLFVGSTGANAYTTRGAHVVQGGLTVADAGIGGAHPYLPGITLPSYVGATNPSDNSWVAMLITDVPTVAWLQAQKTDVIPSEIESGS